MKITNIEDLASDSLQVMHLITSSQKSITKRSRMCKNYVDDDYFFHYYSAGCCSMPLLMLLLTCGLTINFLLFTYFFFGVLEGNLLAFSFPLDDVEVIECNCRNDSHVPTMTSPTSTIFFLMLTSHIRKVLM